MDDETLDFLYGLPLERFTAERNRLAKVAGDEGDRARSAAIRALAKPSVPAWTINQIARVHPETVASLLSVRDELATAQRAEDIRRLSESRLRLVADLRKAAAEILSGAGHAASASTLERVTQSFLGGADDDERALLTAGRLVSHLEAAGFGPSGPLIEDSTRPVPIDRRDRERLRQLDKDADDAEREARERERVAKVAQTEADNARRAADRARHAAVRAREKADKARDALESKG